MSREFHAYKLTLQPMADEAAKSELMDGERFTAWFDDGDKRIEYDEVIIGSDFFDASAETIVIPLSTDQNRVDFDTALTAAMADAGLKAAIAFPNLEGDGVAGSLVIDAAIVDAEFLGTYDDARTAYVAAHAD